MPTVTLPFGSGLDRYTGVMAVEPGSMEDLLNARPLDGKLQLRRGTVLRSTLPAQSGVPCTAVLLLQAVQSQQEAIAVGYYSASREVHVYRITGIGTDPFHIGRWFTLRSGAQDPPVVVAAEVLRPGVPRPRRTGGRPPGQDGTLRRDRGHADERAPRLKGRSQQHQIPEHQRPRR